jgi:hypothetical protein
MAAAVATHTSNCKIVTLGNCLPMHGHPVRVAEELAMIRRPHDDLITCSVSKTRGRPGDAAAHTIFMRRR